MNYPYEFKLNAVQRVLFGGESQNSVAKDISVSKSSLSTWVVQYKADGKNGLKPKLKTPINSPTRISNEVKQQVLNVWRNAPFATKASIKRKLEVSNIVISTKKISEFIEAETKRLKAMPKATRDELVQLYEASQVQRFENTLRRRLEALTGLELIELGVADSVIKLSKTSGDQPRRQLISQILEKLGHPTMDELMQQRLARLSAQQVRELGVDELLLKLEKTRSDKSRRKLVSKILEKLGPPTVA